MTEKPSLGSVNMVYVAVNFLNSINFYFLLFLGTAMYANEF